MKTVQEQEEMAYIGRAACGCIKYAAVDCTEFVKENAKRLGEIIRDGGTVERVTIQYVRDNMRRCPHKSLEG